MKKKPASTAKKPNRLDISASERVKIEAKRAGKSEAEFDPAMPLDNQQHEAFARLISQGRNNTEAYSEVYRTAGRSSEVGGSRVLSILEVSSRVIFLQQQAATGAVMDLREMLEFLTSVKRTPVGKIDSDHELAQRYETDEKGTKVWMPDKRACVELCARLQGMLSDKVKVEHSGTVKVVLTEERRRELIQRRREAVAGVN